MIRQLLSIGLLLFFASTVFAQGDPVVAVARDSQTVLGGADASRDFVALLDSQANQVGVISGVAVSQSISHQNMLQIDAVHQRVLVAENARDRVSVFDYDGASQLEILIKDVSAICLSSDASQIGCVRGISLDDQQTVILDSKQGKEIRRLNWGGVALTNDEVGSQFWAVGRQLIGFADDGEVVVRRPLTRLPPEPGHPTVINSRNWCAVGVAIEPNENDHWRRIWVAEREHSNVKGSRNRLFAIGPDGQTRILVELNDIEPRSIACATYNGRSKRILVVDGKTGDLVSFNSDGELMVRKELHIKLVAFGERSGLWIAGRKSVRRLNPSDLTIAADHKFDEELEPVGLAVR